MKSIEQQLSDANITYNIGEVGIYMAHPCGFIHANSVSGNKLDYIYSKAIHFGFIKKPPVIHIMIYDQDVYEKLNNVSPIKLLTDFGFKIISFEYYSFGPIYFIEVLKTNIKLPEWAERYKP